MQTPDHNPSAADRPIAAQYARWATHLQWRDIPTDVVAQAQHLILDALGIALASGRYPFAQQTLLAMKDLCPSTGPVPVFGMKTHLPARDAALINGLLIHGLDYDDTHPGSVVHATASVFAAVFWLALLQAAKARAIVTKRLTVFKFIVLTFYKLTFPL
jgi:2-methylcitrate dehydratase PrpD